MPTEHIIFPLLDSKDVVSKESAVNTVSTEQMSPVLITMSGGASLNVIRPNSVDSEF